MSALSKTLRDYEGGGISFWCPACNASHGVKVGPDGWQWNGDVEKPTITPSIRVQGMLSIEDKDGNWTGEYQRDAAGHAIPQHCHSNVTDGKIFFHGDSNRMAGQTVDLPEFGRSAHADDITRMDGIA